LNDVKVRENYQKALELYYESAEKGNAHSQLQLGKMFFLGVGVDRDYKAALEWLQKSAGQGNGEAQAYLGTMHEQGLGLDRDNQQALELYIKSAEQGNALGQARLAGLYLAGAGVEQNTHEASSLYQKSAEQGNDEAQAYLGHMYEKGLGVNRDIRQAAELYKKSAEQDNALGQLRLGDFYLNGMGVERNPRKAFSWYQKSAAQDKDPESAAQAQLRLGAMYCQGNGVEKDLKKGFEYYEKSAKLGNVEAQASVGAMYKDGVGVARDAKKAQEWFQKSAKKSKAPSNIAMGDIYRDGLVVARNITEAMKWYKKAADEGDTYAKTELLKLQLEEVAQKKARTESTPASREYVRALIEAANRQPAGTGVEINKQVVQAELEKTPENVDVPLKGKLQPMQQPESATLQTEEVQPGLAKAVENVAVPWRGKLKQARPPKTPKPQIENTVTEKKSKEPVPKKVKPAKTAHAPRKALYLFSALVIIVLAIAGLFFGLRSRLAGTLESLELGAAEITALPRPDPQWIPAMILVPPGEILKKINAGKAVKKSAISPLPVVEAKPAPVAITPAAPLLRREYKSLDEGEVATMLAAKNIFDAGRNPGGNFQHKYEIKNSTGLSMIFDRATNLVWMRQQNPVRMNLKKSQEWIASLNNVAYGGIKNWRLPTIEEAAALLKKNADGEKTFLDAIFGKDIIAIWTGDGFTESESWIVDFQNGQADYAKNKSKLKILMVSSNPN
jgi:TPR repeat protein